MTYAEFVKEEDLNGYSVKGASIQSGEIKDGTVYFDIYAAGKAEDETCILKMSCCYETDNGMISILEADNNAIEKFNLSDVIPPEGTTGFEPVYPTDNPDEIKNFDEVIKQIADRLENGKIEYMERYGTEEVSDEKIRQEIEKPEISENRFEELVAVIEKVADGLSNELDRFDENAPAISEKLEELFGDVKEITPITVSGWIEGIHPHFEIQLDGIACYDSTKDNIKDLVDAYEQYDYNDREELSSEQLADMEPYWTDEELVVSTELPEGAERLEGEDAITQEEKDTPSDRLEGSAYIDSKAANIFPEGKIQTVRSGFVPVDQRIGSDGALLTKETVQEFRQDVPDFGRFMGFDTTEKSSAKTYIVSHKDFSRVCEGLFQQTDGKFEIGSFGAFSDKGVLTTEIGDIKDIKLYVDRNSIGGVRQNAVTAEGKPIRGNVERLNENEVCYRIYDNRQNIIVPLSDIKEGLYEDKGYYTSIDNNGKVEVFHDTKINSARIDGVRVDTYNLCTVEIRDKDDHMFRSTCLTDAKGGVICSDLFSAVSGSESRMHIKADASIPVLNQFETKENSYRSIANDLKPGQNLEDIKEKYEIEIEDKSLGKATSVLSADMQSRMGRIDSLVEGKSVERNSLEKSVNFKELTREICATSLSAKINDISKLISSIDKGKDTESSEKISSMRSELAGKLEDYHRTYELVRPSESAIISGQAIGVVQGIRAEIDNLQETKENYKDFITKDFKENSPRENLACISRIEANAVDRCTISMEIDEQYIGITDGEKEVLETEVEKYNEGLPENERITVGKDGVYTKEGCGIAASDTKLTIPSYDADSERQVRNLYSKEYDKAGIGDNFEQKSKEILPGENKSPLDKSHYAGVTLVAENVRSGIISPMDIIPKIIEENCYDQELKEDLLKMNLDAVLDSGADYISRLPEEEDKLDPIDKTPVSVDSENRISEDRDKEMEKKDKTLNLDKFLKATSGAYARVDKTKEVELSDRAKQEIDVRAEKEATDSETGKIDTEKKAELKEKYTNEKKEQLEKIKEKIVSCEEKLEKQMDSIPRRLHHTDTPISISNYSIDSNVYSYIKEGGKVGKDCFIEKGVTSTHLISDLVSVYQTNIIATIEWRIIAIVASGIEKAVFGEVIGRDDTRDVENRTKDLEAAEEEKVIKEEVSVEEEPKESMENEFPKDTEKENNPENNMEKEDNTEKEQNNDTDKDEQDRQEENVEEPKENTEEQVEETAQENSDWNEKDISDGNLESKDETEELKENKLEETPADTDEEIAKDKSDAAIMEDAGDVELPDREDPSVDEVQQDEGEDGDEQEDMEKNPEDGEEKEDDVEPVDPEPDNLVKDEFDASDLAEENSKDTDEVENTEDHAEEQPVSAEEPDVKENAVRENDTEDRPEMETTEAPDLKEDSFWQYEDGYLPTEEEQKIQQEVDDALLKDREMYEAEPTGEIDGIQFTEADKENVLEGGTMEIYVLDAEWNNEWQTDADAQLQDAVKSSVDMVSDGIDELPQDVEITQDDMFAENIEITEPDIAVDMGEAAEAVQSVTADAADEVVSSVVAVDL